MNEDENVYLWPILESEYPEIAAKIKASHPPPVRTWRDTLSKVGETLRDSGRALAGRSQEPDIKTPYEEAMAARSRGILNALQVARAAAREERDRRAHEATMANQEYQKSIRVPPEQVIGGRQLDWISKYGNPDDPQGTAAMFRQTFGAEPPSYNREMDTGGSTNAGEFAGQSFDLGLQPNQPIAPKAIVKEVFTPRTSGKQFYTQPEGSAIVDRTGKEIRPPTYRPPRQLGTSARESFINNAIAKGWAKTPAEAALMYQQMGATGGGKVDDAAAKKAASDELQTRLERQRKDNLSKGERSREAIENDIMIGKLREYLGMPNFTPGEISATPSQSGGKSYRRNPQTGQLELVE